MGTFLQWLLLAAVVDNLVLGRLLGLPVAAAGGTGQAEVLRRLVARTSLALLMVIPGTWLLQQFLLQPWRLEHLRVLLVSLLALLGAAVAARVVDRVAGERGKDGEALRVAGSTVLLGAALSATTVNASLPHACALGLGAAAGFAVAMHALDAIAERLSSAPVPATFRGLPVNLLAAGLFALGLTGFAPS